MVLNDNKEPTAKSIEKLGKEIKNAPIPSSTTSGNKFRGAVQKPSTSSRTLNWRSPYTGQGNPHMGQKLPYQKFHRATPQNSRTMYSNSSSQAKSNRSTLQDKRK
ncbi:Protein of unknown function [Cotesia congregata]|uniref:Uncharacterized protein n=1 Tax=Cotesia congregata TaxID=51543 RepID=A0A8J2HCJ2_COTCN|nr:Protein of unknown function [Cotesia congregata]